MDNIQKVPHVTEIKTVVTYPKEFKHKAVSGAYCGQTGSDSLFLELFFERPKQTGVEIRSMTPLGPTVQVSFDMVNERVVVGGYSISLETAKMLHGLLGQQIATAESLKKTPEGVTERHDMKNFVPGVKHGQGGYL